MQAPLKWDTKEEDVALWKEMKVQHSTMKRSASQTSIDESPVSIDAVFHDPCLPRTTSSGESGWLVPVEQPGGKEDELEMMLDLDLGPALQSMPTAREVTPIHESRFPDMSGDKVKTNGQSGWFVPREQSGGNENELLIMLDADLGPALQSVLTAQIAAQVGGAVSLAGAIETNDLHGPAAGTFLYSCGHLA